MSVARMLDQEAAAFYGARERTRAINRATRARAVHGAKVSRPIAADREQQMIVMRESGATLEAIGAAFGITRERTRQLLTRNGYGSKKLNARLDPLAIMRAVRSPEYHSVKQIATALGVNYGAVSRFLRETGRDAAVQRLCNWRRSASHRRECIAQLQAFRDRHGRSPYALEFGTKGAASKDPTLPWHSALVVAFGSLPAAFDAAGLERRGVGAHGHQQVRQGVRQTHCRRGHAMTPENTAIVILHDGRSPQHRCRACTRLRSAASYQRRKARAALTSPPHSLMTETRR